MNKELLQQIEIKEGQNEFERFPALSDYLQEYAAYGKFSNWSEFIGVLNAALKQSGSTAHAGARWVKASIEIPKGDDTYHVKIDGIKKMGNFYEDEHKNIWFYVMATASGNDWHIPQHKFSNLEWLDESGSIPTSNLTQIKEALEEALGNAYALKKGHHACEIQDRIEKALELLNQ